MKTTTSQARPTSPLTGQRVIDVMHPGMVSCPPDTDIRAVARMMATYRVHAIFVHTRGDSPDEESWGVVTDSDVLIAALGGVLESDAGQIARTPVLAVRTTEPLERAMQLMNEHEVAHLIVVEGHSGRPIGVVSTLDIARMIAGSF